MQQTRIGRIVNELRKKTKDTQLAKRAKQLVRNWKKLIDESNGVNGEHSRPSPGPAVASSLQVSPACSPALGRSSSTIAGRIASPALTVVKPRTPLVGYKTASPALSGGKPLTPLLSGAVRVASPALVGGKPLTPVPSFGQKVVSPAVSSSHPRTPLLSSTARVSSPAMDHGRFKVTPYSPAVRASSTLSPALHPNANSLSTACRQDDSLRRAAHVSGRATPKDRSKPGVLAVGEDSNGSSQLTPTSVHSENSQDRVFGDRDNCLMDSDSQSSFVFKNFAHKPNHSTGVSLSNSSDKGSSKDQRELSKTNIANRKRAREESSSPTATSTKKTKVDSGSLSFIAHKQDKFINGFVKSNKPSELATDLPRVSSSSSLPSIPARVSSPHLMTAGHDDSQYGKYTNSLHRQENSDSRLSVLTLDRSSKDKNKVKTTEQLIVDLQRKNNSSSVGNKIINQLRTYEIQKERDLTRSVLPAGVKPRSRRKNKSRDEDEGPTAPPSDVTLSQAKSELVEHFLKTSHPSSTFEEYNSFKDDLVTRGSDIALGSSLDLETCRLPYVKDHFDTSYSTSRQDKNESAHNEESSVDTANHEGSLRMGTGLSIEEIYAQLPPVNADINWESVDFYELPEPVPVTDELVERLHSRQWAGVNGLNDLNGVWHGWHQTVSLLSYEGSMLHVLPYVDLDN